MDKATVEKIQKFETQDDCEDASLVNSPDEAMKLIRRLFGNDNMQAEVGHGVAAEIGKIVSVKIEGHAYLIPLTVAVILADALDAATVKSTEIMGVEYQPARTFTEIIREVIHLAKTEQAIQ